MTKETKGKQNDNPSSDLQDALRRQRTRVVRFFYEDAIRHCEEHLKECGKTECIECKDAKALIPYYQTEMEKHLREIFPPALPTKRTQPAET